MNTFEKEESLKHIREIKQHGLNLTDWEEHFVEDMDDRMVVIGTLSQAQREKLKEIWENKV